MAALALPLAVILAGCASPGLPRPPSLHLPATVTDLSASRIGNRVELHWTGPAQTTDGLDLADPKPAPTITEICRDLPPRGPGGAASIAPGAPPPCSPVVRADGHPGPSSAVDTLPSTLADPSANGLVLAYRVRVLNASGRSASASASVLIPAGPPVEEVTGFHAEQGRNGVVLEWTGGPQGTVEVLRTPAGPSPAPPAKPSRQRDFPRGHHAEASPTVHLHADPADPAQTRAMAPLHLDPQRDGMVDTGALAETTYLYQAERVRLVALAGGSVIVRSEPTPPIQIGIKDTFPPRAPSGLASLPGRIEVGPRTSSAPAIDLSWQPNDEPDLAGYLVYRVDLGPLTPTPESRRLTLSPLLGPAYRDADVVAGERYQYRVTAVDRRGNESMPGAPLVESSGKTF